MRGLLAALPLILSACSLPPATPENYLQTKGLPDATLASFPHCYNYGCDKVVQVSLKEEDWQDIEALFVPPSQNAEEERKRISRAIGLFERMIGPITGTQNDVYGTFGNIGTGQHDCIDESTNTTIYLSLLAQKGYLYFHLVSAPDTRSPLFISGRWPHRTAVIIEKSSKAAYGVDSWFHDNGFDAEIVPLPAWKEGWKPAENLRKGRDFSAAP